MTARPTRISRIPMDEVERVLQDALRHENRERYLRQSANTRTGARAPLPDRPRLAPAMAPNPNPKETRS